MDTEVIEILSSDTDSVEVFDTGSPPARIPDSCGAVSGEVLPGPSGESQFSLRQPRGSHLLSLLGRRLKL